MDAFDIPSITPAPRDWKSAPPVVKGWAYPLTWLAIVISGLGIVAIPFANDMPTAEKVGGVIFYAVLLGFVIWLNRGLKRGAPAAWTAQIIVSGLGLLGFPLGTAIHGYILSQWFKPENRAWFE